MGRSSPPVPCRHQTSFSSGPAATSLGPLRLPGSIKKRTWAQKFSLSSLSQGCITHDTPTQTTYSHTNMLIISYPNSPRGVLCVYCLLPAPLLSLACTRSSSSSSLGMQDGEEVTAVWPVPTGQQQGEELRVAEGGGRTLYIIRRTTLSSKLRAM